MYIEAKVAMTAGQLAFQHREKLLPTIKQFWGLLTRGQVRVAIFGPGGAGKTTLGQLLSGELETGSGPGPYRMSREIETHKLKGQLLGRVIVPPGQERYKLSTWPDLYRDLAKGRSVGVINVVSYGYHSFGDLSYKETSYYRDGMTKDEFLDQYLTTRRESELDTIHDLTPRLMDAQKDIWMITLVVKQDLWWKERARVRGHYIAGRYNDCIQSIANHRGKQHFRHEYLSASLVLSNFSTGQGEILAPVTEGYDQNFQYMHLEQLADTLNSFTGG